jgi:hypothetical protein
MVFGRLCLLAGLLALAGPAFSQEPDWRPISNAANGNFSVEFFVDTSSLRRQGDEVEFIERAEFANQRFGWKQVISQSQINCRLNRSRTVRMRITKVNGTVEVLDQRKVAKWAAIAAESNGAFVRDFVCKR